MKSPIEEQDGEKFFGKLRFATMSFFVKILFQFLVFNISSFKRTSCDAL